MKKNAELGDWMWVVGPQTESETVVGARSEDCAEGSFNLQHGELEMSRRPWLKVTETWPDTDARGTERQGQSLWLRRLQLPVHGWSIHPGTDSKTEEAKKKSCVLFRRSATTHWGTPGQEQTRGREGSGKAFTSNSAGRYPASSRFRI